MKKTGIRLLAALLCLVMLAGLSPVLAADGENTFYLVAEHAEGLIIAPEVVRYESGQTIAQALAACGHSFEGLDKGWINVIDGVGGSFTRSDENGGADLDAPASSIRCFRFSEEADSRPSAALLELIAVMAQYKLEEPDVQAAAGEAYDAACAAFVGISDADALTHAAAVTEAIETYKTAQGVTYPVSFSAWESGMTAQAVNAYGKVFRDNDGLLALPAGTYTLTLRSGHRSISREAVEVAGAMTLEAQLPQGEWMDTDSFLLSTSYSDDFDSNLVAYTYDDHTFTASLPDHFAGWLYGYVLPGENVSADTHTLTAIYTNSTGNATVKKLVFDSKASGASGVLARGAAGNTLIYRVSTEDANGFTLAQDYTLVLDRIPTLTGLTVLDQDGIGQVPDEAFAADTTAYTYQILDTAQTLTIRPQADEAYTVTVNGQPLTDGGVEISVSQTLTAEVVVACGAYSTAYTLTFQPKAGQEMRFVLDSAATLVVVNENGDVLKNVKERLSSTKNRYTYTLVPGMTYTYIATQDTWYHASNDFSLAENAGEVVTITVKTDNWLTELALGRASGAGSKGTYALDTAFDAADHEYTVTVSDTDNSVYLWANGQTAGSYTASYVRIHSAASLNGRENTVNLRAGSANGTVLGNVLLYLSPYGNDLTVRASMEEDGVTYYQDYVVHLVRELSISDLQTDDGVLKQPDGAVGFDRAVREYTLSAPVDLTEITLTCALPNEVLRYGDVAGGYRLSVDGQTAVSGGALKLSLSGTEQTDTFTLAVTNTHVPELQSTYTLQVNKVKAGGVRFDTAPADAVLTLRESVSNRRLWPVDGLFRLSEGYSYFYTLSCPGYVGRSGVVSVEEQDGVAVVVVDQQTPVALTDETLLTLSLTEAPVNEKLDPTIEADWADFRGTSYTWDEQTQTMIPGGSALTNNGVTPARTPVDAENGTLYWAAKTGDGFDSEAVGCPILVDGHLIVYAGTRLLKMDAMTGRVVAEGTMVRSSSFAINSPTYAEGMIFVGLSDGGVQAFDAVTLESLWIYNDPLKGQPNCPIVVRDGCLYTGFWNGETEDANFVCLTVTDEDPGDPLEEKTSAWFHTQTGGFYWAGAYVDEQWLLVGTDDADSDCVEPTGSLLLLDRRSGELLDCWEGLDGDVRSSVVYDAAADACYFTSKGGSFYGVRVTQQEGAWQLTDKRQILLGEGSNTEKNPPMSTCSPVIHNGRAYIGVSGVGQFAAYFGHHIAVIDLESWTIAYTVQTQGYPQTSGLLTTAYEEATGYTYVYFFDNYTPGTLRMLRDKQGQTEPELLTTETDKSGTIHSAAYALFTPANDQAQYAICSPIVDEYGTIYFKNDSGYMMAYGSAVKELTVTAAPDKTEYAAGELFDPAGMQVTARYANGVTRDVTDYVTWSTEPLETSDTSVTVSYPWVLYHNAENSDGTMEAAVVSTTPTVQVPVQVQAAAAVTVASVALSDTAVTVTFTGSASADWKLAAAACDENGKMLSIAMAQCTGETVQTLPLSGGVTVKVFVLNENNCPVMENNVQER